MTKQEDLDFEQYFNIYCFNKTECKIPTVTLNNKFTYQTEKYIPPKKFLYWKRNNWINFRYNDKCYGKMA